MLNFFRSTTRNRTVSVMVDGAFRYTKGEGGFLGKMKGWQDVSSSLQADVLTLLSPCLLVMQDQ